MNYGIALMRIIVLMSALVWSIQARAQQGTPPADKPVAANNAEQIKKFKQAISPYVQKARETLPDAKKKYLKGLPKGEQFFVTIMLNDDQGNYEQVFVKVTRWRGETVKGLLSSDVTLVRNHKKGEKITCEAGEILDWLISKPDGSEEGNFVGKFLDTYKP